MLRLYLVFNKENPAGTQTMVGTIKAESPEKALTLALNLSIKDKKPFAWWIIPERMIYKSDPGDAESFFSPAQEKFFRMATDFKTLTVMQQIKRSTQIKNKPETRTDA
jgi:1,2-phenylacetyl-CoA epoxidase PaaB subunit